MELDKLHVSTCLPPVGALILGYCLGHSRKDKRVGQPCRGCDRVDQWNFLEVGDGPESNLSHEQVT